MKKPFVPRTICAPESSPSCHLSEVHWVWRSCIVVALAAAACAGCGRVGFQPLSDDAEGMDAPRDAFALDASSPDVLERDAPNLDAPLSDAPHFDAPALDDAPVLDAPGMDTPSSVDAPADIGSDAPRIIMPPDARVALEDTGVADAPVDGGVDAPGDPPANIIFVSRMTFQGSLGTADALDAVCTSEANAAGFAGRAIALISPLRGDADLGTATGWVRPDRRLVALNAAELVGRSLYHPITLYADRGRVPAGTTPWTGTVDDCVGWTSSAPSEVGSVGDNGLVDRDGWYGSTPVRCGERHPVYCAQVARLTPLSPPEPVRGRRVFISRPRVGVTDPDAICDADRRAAGLISTFRALVAYTGVPAVTRVGVDDRPWVRMDGLPLFMTAAEISGGEAWAPVRFNANRAPVATTVYTGSLRVGGGASSTSTCDDWRDTTSAGANAGSSSYADTRWWYGGATTTCIGAPSFYCIED